PHRVVCTVRRSSRRERLQRAGSPLRQPRERDDRHPHVERAHRRRGSRGDGRRDARTHRRRARLMEERRLGPVVGLGTWNTFGKDAALAQRVVDAAYDAGVRVYDSSPMYRGAEQSLAEALRGRGAVATKIWAQSVEEGREQFARQREWFGRVEIEQIHNLVAWREHLEWLEREDVGKLGVTHYASSAFGELATALRTKRFGVVQLPYNQRECERELLPLAAELGIAVIVM